MRFGPLVARVLVILTMFVAGCARGENLVFPPDAGVINVRKPPYNARGDGVTDDTAALQRAILDYAGQRNLIYLPSGIYLVSATLRIPNEDRQGRHIWGNTHIVGQSRAGVVLRLRDHTFTDPQHSAAVIASGPHGSADWFHNSIEHLTIDTGRNNPGAIGVRFFSNNTGCVRAVTIRSGDSQGVTGLDLGFNDMNGPLLVRDVKVQGFRVGIACGHAVNSQTFSHIQLEGQQEAGFRNDSQYLAIEDLQSRNAVPALENRSGLIALVGGHLAGSGGAKTAAAIVNQADLYARDIHTSGYRCALHSGRGEEAGPFVAEFVSSPTVTLFPSPSGALRLPIRDTPEVPWDAPASWASPFQFGTTQVAEADISDGLQKAIDSGATTVYIPCGSWKISRTIHIRGNVRRLIGMHAYLIPAEPVNSQEAPLFQCDGGTQKVVMLERMDFGFGNKRVYGIQDNTPQTVVLRDMECYAYRNGPHAGPLFIEDVVGGPFTFDRQTVWARQLNQESQGTHIRNEGGSLWILGLKTERGGTLIDTRPGGRTEVLGGLCYTTTAGKLAPMFVNDNASVSVTLGERCYTGDPYSVVVRETRQGVTRLLLAADPSYGGRLALYTGHTGTTGSASR